ncbi:Predicted phosphodiesterase [Aliiroseovarius sediminilitoris]|uniref:Predicted phosphodiesterase n=1 Tax=Aliiroseovarius sediminilitoris TaxID=1173584 RepID=A0A1I0NTK6_9RHOB|nr:metallophosphoesterase family protein [Aliiroseovarius sediminilitoris]SEW04827.1 Predicted phosphodiesterase [Aliiroseovarius sediminilitoris]
MQDFDPNRFAVIADIHSNSDALEAVFQDISDQGIESVVNLGDHLSGPMAASETAELLLSNEMPAIRGNHDRWLVENKREDMISIDGVAFDQLDEHHLNWLRELPTTLWLSEDVFACHGTPKSDTTYWMEKVSPQGDIILRSRDEVADEASSIDASLLLCGHTHLPRRMDLPDGRVVLNPGSVGCPGYIDKTPVHHVVQTGTSAACYAVAEKTTNGWVTMFRHVPYDPSRMIQLAKAANHPNWEARLATGWVA